MIRKEFFEWMKLTNSNNSCKESLAKVLHNKMDYLFTKDRKKMALITNEKTEPTKRILRKLDQIKYKQHFTKLA